MKRIAQTPLLLALVAALAPAQTFNTPIKHVIVVVQENRTPDNLFQDPVLKANGADIIDPNSSQITCYGTPVPLQKTALGVCFDLNHVHGGFINSYDHGLMDGACNTKPRYCTHYANKDMYSYVQKSDVAPCFQIAENYGFANYMFQTNQGPSFPAHQFLFTGTSAPDTINDPQGLYQWFASENPKTTDAGCAASVSSKAYEVRPTDGAELYVYAPPEPEPGTNIGFPCYEHPTMSDLLEANSISWRYYGYWQNGGAPNDIWTAPNAIAHICGTDSSGQCLGSDFTNHVVTSNPTQILSDLASTAPCKLQNVSWVIPDGHWSDHPAQGNGGPDWVANIIDAVQDNTTCDTTNGHQGYWYDTVVLVTWDDWGGFYDHVLPLNCSAGPTGVCAGYPDASGKYYVYGFRVPLLVVSAYNIHGTGGFKGYISGALPGQGRNPPYIHDFGSILNFIEYIFGSGGNLLPEIDAGNLPHYADFWAPDYFANFGYNCSQQLCPYSLHDFFNFGQTPTQPIWITPINYPASYFLNFTGPPSLPDLEDGD
jgi:phospholipase C